MKKRCPWTTVLASSLLLMGWVSSVNAEALTFPKPDDSGRPDRRRGAGSRAPGDNCLTEPPKTLYVLAPENPDTPLSVSQAQTASARPDLFWYVPPTVPGAIAEVRIERLDRGLVYQSSFTLTGKEGLIRYRLPQGLALPPLQSGDAYRWMVRLFCNEDAWLEEISLVQIRSTIKRVAMPLANAEDWSRQLGETLDMYCTSPHEAKPIWSRLMESIELPYFGQAQLLENSMSNSC